MASSSKPSWQFWVDRGGTFTDIVSCDPEGRLATRKLLSVHPTAYKDAAVAGIKATLGLAADAPIPDGLVGEVRIGTTIATNALLERKGEPTLLIVNQGFADLLLIGNQTRPHLFDLHVQRPPVLYEQVVEISGRIDSKGRELIPLDEDQLSRVLQQAYDAGFRSCAVVLMHSWAYPGHEQRVAQRARELGFTQVSASHESSHSVRIVPRGNTTVVDAYLSPILRSYVEQLSRELSGVKLYFMQSNGGLAAAHAFHGKDALLSGPAGGVVGAARTAEAAGYGNVIGFDMGGTSTDVSLYAGAFERAYEAELAGVQVRVPMMAIHTVAAGGGSILEFDGARFRVGPHSAGAYPGPAAYRNGGPLTVTDANVCVGKIQPEYFPSIFGPSSDAPLDANVVRQKFDELAGAVALATGQRKDPRAIAEDFLMVAVTNMANAIKQVSVQKGRNPADFVLQSFGGAGAQHACLVAEALNMDTILIHPFASVLSAFGIGMAEQTVLREKALEIPFDAQAVGELRKQAAELEAQARAHLTEQVAGTGTGQPDSSRAVRARCMLHVRYAGTDTALKVPLAEHDQVVAAVSEEHVRRFGFHATGTALVVGAIEVEVSMENPSRQAMPLSGEGRSLTPIGHATVWMQGQELQVPVHDRAGLALEVDLAGPALIREVTTMVVVEPGWSVRLDRFGNMRMHRVRAAARVRARDHSQPDPMLLEVFNKLFTNVAEQAGAVLQNTARSVNIKERLDFSCAVFDAEGNLVANAPHVPVHLGAMGVSVRAVLASRRESLRPGDSVALNDPVHGGTHLPDITVITPVFDETGSDIRFFVGNRGHHADIGGTAPGSMPPDSSCLEEEGVVIDDFLLVEGGRFREREFRQLLAGARYPARSPDVNVADIAAQVASNQRAVQELQRAIAQYGWPMVEDYMRHVRNNAADNVRRVLSRLRSGSFSYAMDGGAKINVRVAVDPVRQRATIDFTGTDAERADNFNAPLAVTRAVVLYVFRCLVGDDIPLNEGCLEPLDIIVPAGSLLSPSPSAAVVAGNTEISQCLCNALFGALETLAGSQGTMNNFLFGNATYQYYETIGGGTGAGNGFDGASAVQAHMTNTRMTDPEVLELRFPVRLESFAVRRDSGGQGRWRGGDGAWRKLRFLEPMTAVLVSSHREVPPFGLHGGGSGQPGRQWVERSDGAVQPMRGRDRVELLPGDCVVIETPGGGGYGMTHV